MKNRLIDEMFKNRGYDDDFIKSINNYNANELMLNQKLMVDKLYDMKCNKKNITVAADFDADGITASIIAFVGLAELGFNVSIFVPNPDNGYGLSIDVIDELLKTYPNTDVIFTCDVGSNDVEGIKYAKSCNIEVLVTDHHKIKNNNLITDMDILVNPVQPDDNYSNKFLCGATVVYKVLELYSQTYCSMFLQEQIKKLIVFAGIGTIADSMVLHGYNRYVVRSAVSMCEILYSDCNGNILRYINGSKYFVRALSAIHYLLRHLSKIGKINSIDDIDEGLFGFYIAPIFNSAKRVGGYEGVRDLYALFFGDKPLYYSDVLCKLNDKRKILVEKCMSEIDDTSQVYEPYIYLLDVPSGIAGLVASKLMNKSNVPTLVLYEKDGVIKGSGRSPEWFKFLDIMEMELANKKAMGVDINVNMGGHNGAFGISFEGDNPSFDLAKFYDIFKSVYDNYVSTNVFTNVCDNYDYVISNISKYGINIDILMFYDFLSELNTMKPFGRGFEKPFGLLVINTSNCDVRQIGADKKHLKIILDNGFEILLWQQGDKKDLILSNTVKIKGFLELNEFNGVKNVQFVGELLL